MMRLSLMAGLTLVLAACAMAPSDKSPAQAPIKKLTFAESWNCLRSKNLGIVSAHRGQPDPSWPENALSSFKKSLERGIPLLEVDIATTQDGVLVLMHDDTLDRTTTGTGWVAERDMHYISTLRLETPDGQTLDERVPKLEDILDWGRASGARFQLDVKRSTRFEDIIAAVRKTGMTEKVVVITYTLDDAAKVHALAPELMISTSIGNPQALAAARSRLSPHRILGWTGTQTADAKLNAEMRAAGIEPLFGTLGKAGERLDDVYLGDGNPSEYAELIKSGIVMIASDQPAIAQKTLGEGHLACFQ
jgi:glycerophosphoryl diester phosphodiesterase